MNHNSTDGGEVYTPPSALDTYAGAFIVLAIIAAAIYFYPVYGV